MNQPHSGRDTMDTDLDQSRNLDSNSRSHIVDQSDSVSEVSLGISRCMSSWNGLYFL